MLFRENVFYPLHIPLALEEERGHTDGYKIMLLYFKNTVTPIFLNVLLYFLLLII